MPRKPEPSFDLKLIIWDIAATNGTDNYSVIYRELDRKLGELRREGGFFETTPDLRKVKDIIELDIQRLNPEVVVAKLPRYMWHLRKDYEAMEQLVSESIKTEQEAQSQQLKSTHSEFSADHLSDIQDSMKQYVSRLSRDVQLGQLHLPDEYWYMEHDKMFPHVLEHCPSIKHKYETFKTKREDYHGALGPVYRELVVPLMGTMEGKIGQVFEDGELRVTEEPDTIADAFVHGYDPCKEDIICPSSDPLLTEQHTRECQDCYQSIINAKPHLTTYREKAVNALEAMNRAKQELLDTIDTSLRSGEYSKHTCRWCPH